MKKQYSPSALPALITVFLLSACLIIDGCAKKTSQTKGTPKPSATPTPLNIAVDVSAPDTTLFDNNGTIVAQIHAATAAASPAKGAEKTTDLIGLASQATAKLYQKGKPSALLIADTLNADRDTRVLVARGHVIVRSLEPSDAPPEVRADTMTWSYNDNQIKGSGHVIVSRGNLIRLPGQTFTADTVLKTFDLENPTPPKSSSIP